MKQAKKLFGIVVMIIASMTVLAGCASAQQSGGSTSAPSTTTIAGNVSTAADLVRALGGRATVNGNTVTLTGDVGIEGRLVVPEGVTLDITADSARLVLLDGATLTVNGTVNARGGWGNSGSGGSLNIEDGAAVINGSGTINLKSQGNLLNIWGGGNGRRLTLEGVTLVGIADNSESLVDVNNGGEFIMKNGVITGNTRVGGDGGGIGVWQATFTMEGGTISGNTANGGGGVGVDRSAFIMTGGTISANTADSSGGGVKVGDGTFTMTDGTITGNTTTSNTNANSGGVRVERSATFIMEGGTISGNTAIAGENYGGNAGGVGLGSGSTFIMRGGVISGNTATSRSNRGEGGGVQVNESVFIMEGGTIYGSADRLPAGTDTSLANNSQSRVALRLWRSSAKWGTGGTYTMGGVSQTGGSDMLLLSRSPDGEVSGTNDTLIAIPPR